MFFLPFLKMNSFEVGTFFLTYCLSNQLSFTILVRMHKIHVFDEAFFVVTVAMITENVTFSSFFSNHCKGNKFFHHNNTAYQSNPSSP